MKIFSMTMVLLLGLVFQNTIIASSLDRFSDQELFDFGFTLDKSCSIAGRSLNDDLSENERDMLDDALQNEMKNLPDHFIDAMGLRDWRLLSMTNTRHSLTSIKPALDFLNSEKARREGRSLRIQIIETDSDQEEKLKQLYDHINHYIANIIEDSLNDRARSDINSILNQLTLGVFKPQDQDIPERERRLIIQTSNCFT